MAKIKRWVIKGCVDSFMSKEEMINELEGIGFYHFSVELEKEFPDNKPTFDLVMGK